MQTLFLNLGGEESLIVLVILISIPIITYRLGKKAGYNKAKAEAFDKINK
jgi:hypothetical protein